MAEAVPLCANCPGETATCRGAYEDATEPAYACDKCCGHGNEDGHCDQLCRYCGAVAQGRFSIHRDGFDEGPEVALCDACGSGRAPSCAEIWARIAQAPGWRPAAPPEGWQT